MKTQKFSRSQLSSRPPTVEITGRNDKKILGLTLLVTMLRFTHDTGATSPPIMETPTPSEETIP